MTDIQLVKIVTKWKRLLGIPFGVTPSAAEMDVIRKAIKTDREFDAPGSMLKP